MSYQVRGYETFILYRSFLIYCWSSMLILSSFLKIMRYTGIWYELIIRTGICVPEPSTHNFFKSWIYFFFKGIDPKPSFFFKKVW
jgi:hypothetical protein